MKEQKEDPGTNLFLSSWPESLKRIKKGLTLHDSIVFHRIKYVSKKN